MNADVKHLLLAAQSRLGALYVRDASAASGSERSRVEGRLVRVRSGVWLFCAAALLHFN